MPKKTIQLPKMPKLPEPPRSAIGLTTRPILPKIPHPATFGRGPRSIQPGLQTEIQEFPPPPADFVGTLPEWLVHWALTRLGYVPGTDFTFQSSQMGIRWEAGSAVVDFFIRARNLSIRVQGMYWHYEAGSDKQARDILQRQELESRGITVVDIDEDDIRRDPLYYTQRALDGVDLSLAAMREV